MDKKEKERKDKTKVGRLMCWEITSEHNSADMGSVEYRILCDRQFARMYCTFDCDMIVHIEFFIF